MKGRLILLGIAAVFVIILLSATVLTVGAGKVAVVFNQITGGLSSRDQGTTLLIPGLQKPTIYDARVQTYTLSATYGEGEARGDDALEALTNDGQIVKLDVSVRFHLDKADITKLHQTLGKATPKKWSALKLEA